jgi:hypothetical protein
LLGQIISLHTQFDYTEEIPIAEQKELHKIVGQLLACTVELTGLASVIGDEYLRELVGDLLEVNASRISKLFAKMRGEDMLLQSGAFDTEGEKLLFLNFETMYQLIYRLIDGATKEVKQ